MDLRPSPVTEAFSQVSPTLCTLLHSGCDQSHSLWVGRATKSSWGHKLMGALVQMRWASSKDKNDCAEPKPMENGGTAWWMV